MTGVSVQTAMSSLFTMCSITYHCIPGGFRSGRDIGENEGLAAPWALKVEGICDTSSLEFCAIAVLGQAPPLPH